MIKKYSYGNVFPTQAVCKNIEQAKGNVPFFEQKRTKKGYQFIKTLGEDEVVYGLGENVRGINKRGWKYIFNNSDDFLHSEDKKSLYGTHSFCVFDSDSEKFGIFIDYPGIFSYDIGYEKTGRMSITIEKDDNAPAFDLYIISGESVLNIVKQFRELIGRSYIPPRWAFGYGQSRWSYMSADEVREVVKKHRDSKIPLDSVYLDIDYMDHYKDFTINEEKFPDFAEFVQEMKEKGIHLVPIIDAGVKIEPGYEVYEEGMKNGFFCKDENGKEYGVAVWPGLTHFPDFLNPDVRKWFGHKYQILIEKGIEGFWNDMNEPAIFYSEKSKNKMISEAQKFVKEPDNEEYFNNLKNIVSGMANNPDDYASFYHNTEIGTVCHKDIHNLYGYNMTRAAGEVFDEMFPNHRILMFSRSSYTGMHRYGGIWMGDNMSWWSHILLNLQMLPSLNMSGILYTGADIGGFGGDATEELMLRWLALGIFTPLMRNHSALGTRRQEVYQFENLQAFREIIGLRYRMIPYLYSEYMKAALNDDMMFMPLSFEYQDDEMARNVEDQLLVGESIMIAPVYKQNAVGRYVYLPEAMKLVKFKGDEYTEEILEKGHHYVSVALDEVPVFIRKDKLMIIGEKSECEQDIDYENVSVIAFAEHEVNYEYYHDDGYGKDYDKNENITFVEWKT